MDKRIYFLGSHTSGKTTLARWVSQEYNLPMISEVARQVLAEYELSLDNIFADINATNKFQLDVLNRQIQIEKASGASYVSDRAFDSLAYMAEHTSIMNTSYHSKEVQDYISYVSKGVVFFVRPSQKLVKDDGTRAKSHLAWDNIVRIDGMVKLLLEVHGVPYISLDSACMQERIRTIDYVLWNVLKLKR
jgi:nicotinamide riboside kinase